MSGGGSRGMESVATSPFPTAGGGRSTNGGQQGGDQCCGHYFQMPLHYPRYTKADYKTMPEWRLDCLLKEYGLPVTGNAEAKRKFAMGAFLWPH